MEGEHRDRRRGSGGIGAGGSNKVNRRVKQRIVGRSVVSFFLSSPPPDSRTDSKVGRERERRWTRGKNVDGRQMKHAV